MLTRLLVRNFKTLAEADIELGSTVVLVGPNNSGKTSALQALALWQTGLRQWRERRGGGAARERSGVTLNRTALTHTPVPDARALWRDLRVNTSLSEGARNGAPKVFIDVLVEGQDDRGAWRCGFEYYHANSESIYCRPLLLDGGGERAERMPVPDAAAAVRIAYLPPMSGLVAEEPELKPGRVDVLIGEGQTAQVLRNLCLTVQQDRPDAWARVKQVLRQMFGVSLHDPTRRIERGSIVLTYADERGTTLDLSSAGRGLQQTLLLLAHIAGNPGAVLLFDEPDAHLEILRQREIYDVIVNEAAAVGSQVVAASHSEVVLDTAAQRDVVIGFVGRPHRINASVAQLRKALRDIPFDHYFQARQKGSVLYLEGATDLRLLLAFAERLGHPAADGLRESFVHDVANQPNKASEHFYGLREAVPELRCFALFDRLDRALPDGFALPVHCWRRREIENYLALPPALLRFAQGREDDLFGLQRRARMEAAIAAVEQAFRTLGRDPWDADEKVSEQALPAIFRQYYNEAGLRDVMAKGDYHQLVEYMQPDEINAEVRTVLDRVQACLQPA